MGEPTEFFFDQILMALPLSAGVAFRVWGPPTVKYKGIFAPGLRLVENERALQAAVLASSSLATAQAARVTQKIGALNNHYDRVRKV